MMLTETINRAKTAGDDANIDAWDRLWAASRRTLPTLRARCLERFAREFASPGKNKCRIATVRRQGELVAALPLVARSRLGLTLSSELPLNPWMPCGDLLIDQRYTDALLIYDELADQVTGHQQWLLDFQWVEPSREWDQLLLALERKGWSIDRQLQFETGVITIGSSWESYLATRSRSHRHRMRASLRQLERVGQVAFERHRDIADSRTLELLLDEALAIEHSGWKGEEGTSIRSRPDIESFYRDIARLLNADGMLEMQFLRVDGRAIAFELGYVSEGTFHSHKVGYDPCFARYGPGQLLVWHQLQHWFSTGDIHTVDTMGILGEATAKWCNDCRSRYRYRAIRPGRLPRIARSVAQTLRNLLSRSAVERPECETPVRTNPAE